MVAGGGELRISDLIAGLGPEARRLGAARRTLEKLDKQTKPVQPPLPGPVRRRKQRQAGCVSGPEQELSFAVDRQVNGGCQSGKTLVLMNGLHGRVHHLR